MEIYFHRENWGIIMLERDLPLISTKIDLKTKKGEILIYPLREQ